MPDIDKKVRDIMVDVFEFPHVPYWFTLRQVSGILKKSLAGGKCLRPLIVLVFDENYNLMRAVGKVRPRPVHSFLRRQVRSYSAHRNLRIDYKD